MTVPLCAMLALIAGSRREQTRSEDYYSILNHELTHWTSAPKRLNRELGKRFGDHQYAAEELVAELGSAFLCAELGISSESPLMALPQAPPPKPCGLGQLRVRNVRFIRDWRDLRRFSDRKSPQFARKISLRARKNLAAWG